MPLARSLTVAVFNASADTVDLQQQFIDKEKLPYALLADTDLKLIQALGIQHPKGKMAHRASRVLLRIVRIHFSHRRSMRWAVVGSTARQLARALRSADLGDLFEAVLAPPRRMNRAEQAVQFLRKGTRLQVLGHGALV